VPEGRYSTPFGQADVPRQGTDVTIVACGIQVHRALAAAETLASEDGISVEVVDPQTLDPLDKATILASVQKTGRVVVTDESHDTCGAAAGLAAIIADEGFSSLRAPIKRVSTLPVPIPYARTMEEYVTPTTDRIIVAVREVVGGR
jgi:acetoin:2,6-dichlorophenolindophenol oxidoreductase subunit beta